MYVKTKLSFNLDKVYIGIIDHFSCADVENKKCVRVNLYLRKNVIYIELYYFQNGDFYR